MPFSRNAVLVPTRGYLPAVGGTVTFTLGRLRAKSSLVALDVRAAVQPGFVDRCLSSAKGIPPPRHPATPPPHHPPAVAQDPLMADSLVHYLIT